MNKLVKTDYPVEKLPEDIRAGLDPTRPAIVIVAQAEPGDGPLSRFIGRFASATTSPDEIVRHVRGLRDEWPD